MVAKDGLLHKAEKVQRYECPMLCGKTVEAHVAVFEEPGSDDADKTWFDLFREYHACPDCKDGGFFA